ncbi:hypothetical protein BDW74DRAFT_156885 [Aspergillus multicolor]|uniref:uncharacterized protein n=1 Tax=Aspergillus multicolor TaxID=41759 RepID=UPI003CCD47C4
MARHASHSHLPNNLRKNVRRILCAALLLLPLTVASTIAAKSESVDMTHVALFATYWYSCLWFVDGLV